MTFKRTIGLTLSVTFGLLLLTTGCKKDGNYNISRHHRKAAGYSANDLLSDDKYKSAIVEIQYMTGYEPSQASITNLKNFLSQRLNKSNGIRFVYSEIPAAGQSSYTLADIRDIEEENRGEFTKGKEIATYFLFVDGEFSENTSTASVVGVSYYNTSMVIFEKTIKEATGGIGQPDQGKVETTVLLHEFGHLLGLVNLGSTMQTNHQDAANGNHCNNTNCLMNWEVGGGEFMQNLMGTAPVPGLDQNCIDDLQANGGK